MGITFFDDDAESRTRYLMLYGYRKNDQGKKEYADCILLNKTYYWLNETLHVEEKKSFEEKGFVCTRVIMQLPYINKQNRVEIELERSKHGVGVYHYRLALP